MGAPGHDHDGTDAGAAYVFVRRGDFPLPQAELRASDASAGAGFGEAVSIDGDTVVVGAPDAAGAGAVYVFGRTRGVWTQTARLTASDAAAGARFGASVALDGDTLVAGAPGSGGGAGGAYVFVLSGGTWAEQTRFGGEAGSRSGASVGLDGGLLVVGAPGARGSAGEVRMYEGAGASWALAASFSPPDVAGGDELGAAVAISGTVVVAGARNAAAGASAAGAAHVFERLCGSWRRTARLAAPSPVAGAHFGAGVAAEGSIIAVGAPGDVDRAVASGAAHLFRRTADGWTADARPVAGDRVDGDGRGTAVALADGACAFGAPGRASAQGTAYVTTTAAKLVSSPGEAGETAGGAVAYSGDTALVGGAKDRAYVFREIAGAWSLEATLEPGDVAEQFGCSVGLEGDTAVVGARWDHQGGSRAGAAYVFGRSAGVWTQQAKLVASDAVSGAWFGDSVAMSAGTVLVGSRANAAYAFVLSGGAWAQQAKLAVSDAVLSVAIDRDLAVLGSRRAYFFARTGTAWTLEATVENPEGSGTFGTPVALSGTTALVGWSGAGYPASEAVHVYDRASGTWMPQDVLRPAEGVPGIWFGVSVALDGDVAVVGAALDGDRDPDAGAAYVYARAGGPWRQIAKLTAPDGSGGDWFGRAVAVRDCSVLVGAPRDDAVANSSGAAWVMPVAVPVWDAGVELPVSGAGPSVALQGDTALVAGGSGTYVCVRSGGVWTQEARLTPSDAVVGSGFGLSLALFGDTAVVSAYQDDDVDTDAGAAYVFVRSGGVWTQETKLHAPGGQMGDQFGWSAALSADGLLIGAPGPGGSTGAAFAFVRTGGAWTLQAKLAPTDPPFRKHCGTGVAIEGDLALVGAPADGQAGTSAGAVYAYRRTGGVWLQEAKLTRPDLGVASYLGSAVALSGGSALVGTRYIAQVTDLRAVALARVADAWTPDSTLYLPAAAPVRQFYGTAVAIDGALAVVGSHDDGSAHVFVRAEGAWVHEASLPAPAGGFARSVAISGETVLVGCEGAGKAYVFTRGLRTGVPPTSPVPVLPLPGAWTAGHPLAVQATAAGGAPPYQWRVVAGALPAGLALDLRTGRVTGAASETGTFEVTVECADAFGAAANAEAALTIHPTPDIAPLVLDPAVAGRPYLLSVERSGGTGPFAWTFDDGGAGLAFDPATTVAAGTPRAAGTFGIAVSATDAVGAAATPRSGALRVLDLLDVPRGTLRFGVSADAGPRERVLELVGGTRVTVSARVPRRATAPVVEVLDAAGAPLDAGRSLRSRRGESRLPRFTAPATGRYVLRVTPTDTDPLALVEVTVVLDPPDRAARAVDLAAGESDAFEFSTLPGAGAVVTVAARPGERVAPEIAGVFDAEGNPIPFRPSRSPRSVTAVLRDLPGGDVTVLVTARNGTSGRATAAAVIREPAGYAFELPDLPAGR